MIRGGGTGQGQWAIAERSITAKSEENESEDRLEVVESDTGVSTAAVIDGTSSKTVRRYDGRTSGALAAERVAAVIRKNRAAGAPHDIVPAITAALSTLRSHWDIPLDDPTGPSAVAAVLSPSDGLVWRVGDVHIAVRSPTGWVQHPADKAIDGIVAAARSALLSIRLKQGISIQELAQHDEAREMLMPILANQNVFANLNSDGPLAFGTLNGLHVPERFIEIFRIPSEATEIVLASDGYLSPARTLADAEEELATSLRADPLRIGAHASTKGVLPGARSFDDRTYLRLKRE